MVALCALLEPLSVDPLPVIKFKKAGDQIFQALLHLHCHSKLNWKIFNWVVYVNAKVVDIEEINEVEIQFSFERIDCPSLVIIVESRHIELWMDYSVLFRVELKSHSVVDIINVFLIPIPAKLPFATPIDTPLIVIVLKFTPSAIVTFRLPN